MNQSGARNPAWKGGRYVASTGYVLIYRPEHPRTMGDCYVQEHTLVAEAALGKYLPPLAIVHHVDDNRQNNAPTNLVICENTSYHRLLHTRRTAYRATGNPNARKCGYCHDWVSPSDPDRYARGNHVAHRRCRQEYSRSRYTPEARRARYEATGR